MEDIVKGLSLILEFENIILILGGVLIGVLVGALPGLSSPMAIALLIPFTITPKQEKPIILVGITNGQILI